MAASQLGVSTDGSFGQFTLATRIPKIIRDVQSRCDPNSNTELLKAIADDPGGHVIRTLQLPEPDLKLWRGFFDIYSGRSAKEVPFFLLEAYFYGLILQETRYFENQVDPFLHDKQVDLSRSTAGMLSALEKTNKGTINNQDETWWCVELALFGNSADMSNVHMGHRLASEVHLIHCADRADFQLALSKAPSITYLVDNAYSELWFDLVLVDHLLTRGSQVKLVVKAHPMLVSDATESDVRYLLSWAIRESGSNAASDLANRLLDHWQNGLLTVEAWKELNAPLHFSSEHFREKLRGADLFIVKGDANYRRIFEDRDWTPTTPLTQAGCPFIAPAMLLRVLKSECIAGLSAAEVASAAATSKDWLVNGRNAVVQWLPGARQHAMSTSDHAEITQRTYDQIANRYDLVNTPERRVEKELSMDRFTTMLSGKNVLVAGCGTGADSRYLRKRNLEVLSVDYSPNMLHQARMKDPDGRYWLLDLREVCELNQQYHGIWASACLYHLKKAELKQWLRGIRAILHPGGVLYMSMKQGIGEVVIEEQDERYSGGLLASQNLKGARFYALYERLELEGLFNDLGFGILHFEPITRTQPGFEYWLSI